MQRLPQKRRARKSFADFLGAHNAGRLAGGDQAHGAAERPEAYSGRGSQHREVVECEPRAGSRGSEARDVHGRASKHRRTISDPNHSWRLRVLPHARPPRFLAAIQRGMEAACEHAHRTLSGLGRSGFPATRGVPPTDGPRRIVILTFGEESAAPIDLALEFLDKNFPLQTPEWAAWRARMRTPEIGRELGCDGPSSGPWELFRRIGCGSGCERRTNSTPPSSCSRRRRAIDRAHGPRAGLRRLFLARAVHRRYLWNGGRRHPAQMHEAFGSRPMNRKGWAAGIGVIITSLGSM